MTDPIHTDHTLPSAEALAVLNCLRTAVTEALERKRRLGHYWVEWTAEAPLLLGPDAPRPTTAKPDQATR